MKLRPGRRGHSAHAKPRPHGMGHAHWLAARLGMVWRRRDEGDEEGEVEGVRIGRKKGGKRKEGRKKRKGRKKGEGGRKGEGNGEGRENGL